MRDNHFRDADKSSKHDEPPNSRLFVAHTKQISEDELRDAFEKFGNLEDIWLCKDKHTGEQKDIAFIKFCKTSDAARAMESLNGKTLEGHPRPLKVTIALSRDQSNIGGKADDMERFLRLFVVVPRSMTEEDVTNEFQKYGELDYVSVVKDRETKESKGYAFIKYTKASHAAVAFEESDRSFKAVFARPKDQDQQRKGPSYSSEMYDRPMQSSPYSKQPNMPPPSFNRGYGGMEFGNRMSGGNRPEVACLSADVPSELTDQQLRRLFDLMPGFLNFKCVKDGRFLYDLAPPRMEVRVEYENVSSANYALEKLNGFEYPIGKRIYLNPCNRMGSDSGILSGKRDSTGLPTAPEITQELATLTKALAEATNMIKLQVGGALAGGRMNSSETFEPSLCSARLPPPQQLARKDSKSAERLFIMGSPSLPPNNALWDVFGRFGDLIEVYIINGKNCGFVNYARKESADRALEALNGEEIYNMRLKITYADPPKSDSRKRIKMDTDA